MKKVLVVNVSSTTSGGNKDGKPTAEFELTELNKHLAEGWAIENYDIVSNQIAYNFSIIYQLVK